MVDGGCERVRRLRRITDTLSVLRWPDGAELGLLLLVVNWRCFKIAVTGCSCRTKGIVE